jgi:muramoyltetrapeptide carboxypeptidase
MAKGMATNLLRSVSAVQYWHACGYHPAMFDRRSALIGLAAAAPLAAFAKSGAGAAPRKLAKPPRLKRGDTVGLVAPAGFVADRFGLEELGATVRAMGLVPKFAPNLMERYGYLAGTDESRAQALNAMFRDREVRAIFAVRGGWGCERILPLLDFRPLSADPRLLIGSSDITALHLAIAARANCPSLHGPNLASSWNAAAYESFRKIAFDAEVPTYGQAAGGEDRLVPRANRIRTFHPGLARGRLLGGNLSVLVALVGTPYLPDFSGEILFLEDTNEAEYRIDRMLSQLALGGILGKVAGVVFGQCTNCANPGDGYSNFTIYEVLEQHLGKLGVPTFQGAQIGHIAGQVSIPVGIEAEIDAGAGTIRILEPLVS